MLLVLVALFACAFDFVVVGFLLWIWSLVWFVLTCLHLLIWFVVWCGFAFGLLLFNLVFCFADRCFCDCLFAGLWCSVVFWILRILLVDCLYLVLWFWFKYVVDLVFCICCFGLGFTLSFSLYLITWFLFVVVCFPVDFLPVSVWVLWLIPVFLFYLLVDFDVYVF